MFSTFKYITTACWVYSVPLAVPVKWRAPISCYYDVGAGQAPLWGAMCGRKVGKKEKENSLSTVKRDSSGDVRVTGTTWLTRSLWSYLRPWWCLVPCCHWGPFWVCRHAARVVKVNVLGPCYHQRPFGYLWSGLVDVQELRRAGLASHLARTARSLKWLSLKLPLKDRFQKSQSWKLQLRCLMWQGSMLDSARKTLADVEEFISTSWETTAAS